LKSVAPRWLCEAGKESLAHADASDSFPSNRALPEFDRRMKFKLPLQNKAFLHLLAGQNMAVPVDANVPSRFFWRRDFARMRN
jgi:hypothetical protein